MKLLIITTNFPRWEGDPHSPWLVELLRMLRAEGVEVEILAPSFRGLASHTIEGMPVHRFRYALAAWETLTHEAGAPTKIRQNPLYLLLLPIYLLAGLLAAWRLSRRTAYDVIHVHWPVPQGLLGVAARQASRGRPRLVATFYGADLVLVKRFPALRPFLHWFVARCDDVAAISSYTRRELETLTGVQARIIPYGVAMPPAETRWPGTSGRILFVGRLIPRKGLTFLIQAMERLADCPGAHLVIVGDGPERPRLEAQVCDAGLQARVIFAGRVSDEELEAHYQQCAVFTLPAIVDAGGDTEMLGMVLLEAMRYRKPVVASNVGGIPDIVQDGKNGLLVPQQDPEALAAALRRVLMDVDLAHRLGDAGYAYARDHFGWPAVLAETRRLLGEQKGFPPTPAPGPAPGPR